MSVKGVSGYESVSFIYLNHALDIVERIDDGDHESGNVSNADFATTDFPTLYILPKTQTVPKAEMEKVNDWVLTMSIDNSNNIERKLPTTSDPQTGEQFYEASLISPSGNTFPECAVTGYPIVGGSGLSRCSHCKRPASQVDWNRYVMAAKVCPWCG
uniref:Intraflagellar transport protein 172 n=1 Tax=Lygus hesperus TaxID=30085 RepID=A0A146LRG1_LYGHE